MTHEESIQGTVDADIGGARRDTDIGDGGVRWCRRDTDIGGARGTEGIDLKMLVVLEFLGATEGFFDMTREESIQGAVDADIGGAGGDTDISDARGSEGGAGGDTDIGGAGGSEGIELEDVSSFRVPRGSGGGAVGNIDADIGGTGGSEGIELEDISSFGVPRGSGEGAVGNIDAGGSSSRSSSRSARLTTGHGGSGSEERISIHLHSF
ncbi:hypothetical protein GH714_018919 [Hevea brasiliensis]|uniref:Uncharacterized protein n=1 Tax=Hevea brasiliensis TaxID=3981 RepID=A0A6A6KW99_HEVBR|nr:hypothetical protein GH714_018919 [Hevea brasiliensis]